VTWVAATRLALGIALAIPSTSCATSARDAPRISDSTTSVSSTYSRTLASGLGRPLPPQSDCVFPGSEELARLKATSTAIAEGTVGPSSTTTSSPKIEVVDFAVTKVLGTTSRPSTLSYCLVGTCDEIKPGNLSPVRVISYISFGFRRWYILSERGQCGRF